MNNQPDLQAIREFLENLGYEFSPQYASIRFPGTELWFITNNEISPIKEGLEHYLRTQLGIHWQPVSVVVLNHPSRILNESTRETIKHAINYLEALEKGETE